MEQVVLLASAIGFGPIGVALIGVIGVALPFIYKEWKGKTKKNFKVGKKELLSHPLFYEMDKHIEYIIPRLNIENPFKKRISVDFLVFKFNTFRKLIQAFVEHEEYKATSKNELMIKIQALVHEGIEEYNKQAKYNNIPELFITQFNTWHNEAIEVFLTSLERICNSEYFDTEHKVYNTLFLFTELFNRTILDCESTLSEINGHMVGMEYKGIICPKDVYK